jgi:hypothetical protein
MERSEIDELRNQVSCAAVLEHHSWVLDARESTARAMKYRRGAGEIIIVIHGGKGWFDPLSEAKGDVFSLATHLMGDGFAEAVEAVRSLVGVEVRSAEWRRPTDPRPHLSIIDRWRRRAPPEPGSATWRYLTEQRRIPGSVMVAAMSQDLLREGPQGSVWAAHLDDEGTLVGWEERGPNWRGFATGGVKTLFRLGDPGACRICVTEAAIDAMSLAALESLRPDTLYLSTGGGWSPATDLAIATLARRPNTLLIAATDNDRQGTMFAGRLAAIAQQAGARYDRLMPAGQDWNRDLQNGRTGIGGKQSGNLAEGAAACPPAASRVKLRPADAGP